MKKSLQILNGIAFGSTVFINYLSNTGIMDGKTIGTVSDDIKSLFTPAGYAFSIWGIIYLLLLGFSIYQGRSLFKKGKEDDFIEKIGFWFIISCIANSFWIFSWIYGYTGLSCIFIFLLLISLLKIIINLNINLDKSSRIKFTFLYLPFIIYSGWVTVASVANVSSYLVKIGWNGFGITDEIWTIIMIIIAVILNTTMLFKRNMSAFALVGAWALIAIGVANQTKQNTIGFIAFLAAGVLLILVAIQLIKNRKLPA
ncbi:tryptophan-rich sensory protein [Polaribacter sp. R77954]|uniref:tryptophan-rich sensory protein n=1 Tax=Polaribacter sp. R77954 TaxID=3093870 RepID=UPI0037C7887C